MRSQRSTGGVDVVRLDQGKSLSRLSQALGWGEVLRDLSPKKNDARSCPGVTGVGNDAAAVSQPAVRGKVTASPFFMGDDVVRSVLDHRPKDQQRLDNVEGSTLQPSLLLAAPDDVVNCRQRARPLACIRWPPGQEPFDCVVEARSKSIRCTLRVT